jgi:hypothetical protein
MIGDPSRTTTERNYKRLDWQTDLSALADRKELFAALANPSDLSKEIKGAGYRDRPLGFQWRTPRGMYEALGMPAARNSAYETCRRTILGEALIAAENGQGVSYSRRKSFYADGKRYRGAAHTFTTVVRAVAELVQEGWLHEHRVAPNHRGWQSSFWSTTRLIQAASRVAVQLKFDGREIIRLKDAEGHLIDYPETRDTLRLRDALERINAHLKEIQIELPGAVRQGRLLCVGEACVLPRPGNGLYRIFSRGRFSCHGRAYGGDLTIDGEGTVEVDYTALHPAILYCERGIKFCGDPYDIDDFPRNSVKFGFNIAVNAPNTRSAVGALANKVGISSKDAAHLLAAIKKRHKPISEAFCSDAGMRLMRVDSKLILGAVSASNDDGFAALPVHDSLIVPAHFAGRAEEKLVESFELIVGHVNPCQVKTKGKKVPHLEEKMLPSVSSHHGLSAVH